MGGPIQRAPRLDRLRDVDVSGAAQYDLVMRGAAKFVKATPAEVRAALEVPRRASGGTQYALPGYDASGDFVDSGISFSSGALDGSLSYVRRSGENRIVLNGIGGNLVKGGTNVASWSASGLFVGAGGGLAAAPLECRSTTRQARFSYSDLVYWDWITTSANDAQLTRAGSNEWIFARSGITPMLQCNNNGGSGIISASALLGLGVGVTPSMWLYSNKVDFRQPVQLNYSANVPTVAGDPGVAGEIAWDGVNLYLHDGSNWRTIASSAM